MMAPRCDVTPNGVECPHLARYTTHGAGYVCECHAAHALELGMVLKPFYTVANHAGCPK
jgi:hypothetical protein